MTELNEISSKILNCAFRVHYVIGPGMLESVYQVCLSHELRKAGLIVREQVSIDVVYDTTILPKAFRADILVNDSVIIELKCVDQINEDHIAQTLTYLKFGKWRLGLILNFSKAKLTCGIRRVIL